MIIITIIILGVNITSIIIIIYTIIIVIISIITVTIISITITIIKRATRYKSTPRRDCRHRKQPRAS